MFKTKDRICFLSVLILLIADTNSVNKLYVCLVIQTWYNQNNPHMDKNEIFKYLTDCKIFWLATTEGDTPHVRGIFLHKADETGISFTTGKFRDLYKQLKANPKVELCFSMEKSSIRVSGRVVELDDDMDLKKEIVASRPFMKPWIDNAGYAPMAVFKVVDCVATTWSFDKTLAPKTYVSLS